MSDELVSHLRAEIARLGEENKRVKAEAIKRRKAKGDLQARLDEAEKQIKSLTSERDDWKGKAETVPDPDAKDTRIAELEKSLRLRDRRDDWRKPLDGKLRDKVTTEDVWAAAGYEPGAEPPTEQQLADLLGKAREARPYLFRDDDDRAGATSAGAPGGARDAGSLFGPGGGQGAPDRDTGKFLRVRRSDGQDPVFMAQNQSKIAEAMSNGTLRWID